MCANFFDPERLSTYPNPVVWCNPIYDPILAKFRQAMESKCDGVLTSVPNDVSYDDVCFIAYNAACLSAFKGHVSIKRSKKRNATNVRIYSMSSESSRKAQAYDENGLGLKKTIQVTRYDEETECEETVSIEIPILKKGWFYVNQEAKEKGLKKVKKDTRGSGVILVPKEHMRSSSTKPKERVVVNEDSNAISVADGPTLGAFFSGEMRTFKAKPPKRQRAPRPPKVFRL